MEIARAYLTEWISKGVHADIPTKIMRTIYQKFYRWLITKIMLLTKDDILAYNVYNEDTHYNYNEAVRYIFSDIFKEHCEDLGINYKKAYNYYLDLRVTRGENGTAENL